jgi:hypothetical protein
MTAHLDEEQIQSLLRSALGEGGLGDACERYETQDSDVAGSDVFAIHAGGLDKRVENLGSAPFGALTDYLRNFDRSGIPTSVLCPTATGATCLTRASSGTSGMAWCPG